MPNVLYSPHQWSAVSTTTSNTDTYVTIWRTTTSNTDTYVTIWPDQWRNSANTACNIVYYLSNTEVTVEVRCAGDPWEGGHLLAAEARVRASETGSRLPPAIPEPPPLAPEASAVHVARSRAESLLLDHLSGEQREQYRKHSYFDVRVNGHLYRIREGWVGNITRLSVADPAVHLESLCIHFDRRTPFADLLLAQKLALEADERAFRRVANITAMCRARPEELIAA